jgi:membrane-bound ClpP family serine protease
MTALGMSLLLIGVVAVVLEAHIYTHGLLGGPGVAVLAIGAGLAVDGLGGGAVTGLLAALVLALVGLAVVALSVRGAATVRRRRIRTGPEAMIGRVGVVSSWAAGSGKVLVDGGLWRARLMALDDVPASGLNAGDEIVVERLSGLTLAVRRAEEWELTSW